MVRSVLVPAALALEVVVGAAELSFLWIRCHQLQWAALCPDLVVEAEVVAGAAAVVVTAMVQVIKSTLGLDAGCAALLR